MADSNITKRALAAALRELMEEVPFEKINVAHICEKCEMNRKSFYYHFKDKYDLVNWIFDTEFIAVIKKNPVDTGWEFLKNLCDYLYKNGDFYRKALRIEGQNSFSEHFRELLLSVIRSTLCRRLPEQEISTVQINFFADAFVSAIVRWVSDKDCVPPDAFLGLLRSCLEQTALWVYQEMSESE